MKPGFFRTNSFRIIDNYLIKFYFILLDLCKILLFLFQIAILIFPCIRVYKTKKEMLFNIKRNLYLLRCKTNSIIQCVSNLNSYVKRDIFKFPINFF